MKKSLRLPFRPQKKLKKQPANSLTRNNRGTLKRAPA
jgi:hypothetical protein